MSEKKQKKNIENNEISKRIDKEKHEEILKIYKEIKKGIGKAIEGYKKAWKGTEKEVFAEMAFCILTPQSKAKNAWQAITTLVENGLLYNGKPEEIVEFLNIVRFKNNKSRYLVELRELMTKDGKLQPKKILSEIGDTLEKRKWILKNIKGISAMIYEMFDGGAIGTLKNNVVFSQVVRVSKHDGTTITSTNEYAYEYNANGYPIKVTSTHKSSDSSQTSTETYRFTYNK